MKEVSDRELAAVSALPGAERYGYFVREVADQQELWTLQTDEGFVLLSSGEQELVPVWPHRRFAQACADAEWAGAVPVAIPLDRWLQAWTAGMARDGRAVAVFPVPSGQGVVVDPDRLAGDLAEECEQYD